MSLSYTQTGFAEVSFVGNIFNGWCTDTNAGQIGGVLACPDYDGPTPFGYNASTGRFNAIGATDLDNLIEAYSTFGDAQLLEVVEVPALSHPMVIALALAVLAIGAMCIRRGAGAV